MSASIDEISGQHFDYVVIGGGPAGLTVAARLSEAPSVRVALLEAGPANFNDPLIMIPAQFGLQMGNPKYDWFFQTVPQKHAGDRACYWSRGRMLGGSSAINFYAWSKPPAQDVNAWETLGNPGWNWRRFQESAKSIETFTRPKEVNVEKYKHTFREDAHGFSGPLQTSFPDLLLNCEVPFLETLHNAGLTPAKDPLGGDPIGTYMSVSTLDQKSITRSYAATAFYEPNKERKNLRVLCEALVHRLVLVKDGEAVRATGVEFEYEGKMHTVLVKKEAILSAGTLKSPQILELSGIGNPSILEPLDVKTVIDLPGVGGNMQDRLVVGLSYELNPERGIETLDALDDEKFAALQKELYSKGEGLHRLGLGCYTFVPLSSITATPEDAKALITRQRRRVDELIQQGNLPPGLKHQYELQMRELESGKGADCEIIFFAKQFTPAALEPGKTYITILAALSHPFSRGTTHVKSKDGRDQPEIDPHYFEEEFDLDIMVEMFKYIRRLPQLEPLKSMITKETVPGPDCSTEEHIREYLRKNAGTTYHTVGSLSMLPRASNGVVDPHLLVYGTKNVRAADLSIVPLQIAAHHQATAYTIGEIASRIIKAGGERDVTV